tara:strand:- start:6113 stop:6454 length:342 start_codon:yes stop_codon:yes gene_type:complete
MPNDLISMDDLYNIYKSWNGRGEEHREQHEYKNEMIEVEFFCYGYGDDEEHEWSSGICDLNCDKWQVYIWKCYFDEESGWWDTYRGEEDSLIDPTVLTADFKEYLTNKGDDNA